MNNIYVTSDFHFGHDKEFLYKPRGFNSIQEHDEKIIENFNKVMDWGDTIYILGDIMLNDNFHGIQCLRQIPGDKFIITGNHCTPTRLDLYKDVPRVKCIGYADMIKYDNIHFYLSHYPTITGNFDYDKPLKARVINLCGHSHTDNCWADWDKGTIYHCEIDANNCYPFLLDQICAELRKKIQTK